MAREGETVLGMADDEFLKLNSPPPVEKPEEDSSQNQEEEDKGEEEQEETTVTEGKEDGGEETPDTTTEEEGDDSKKTTEEEEEAGQKGKGDDNLPDDKSNISTQEESKDKQEKTASPGSEDKNKEKVETPDYRAFYEKIMAPLRANGKNIELKSPEEAVQLMQMGANYTRKMQAIAPHRKVLLMLENNGLLDEGKLSFLIDIEKKNPEAIKKLLKDSGIDPLEIDTGAESTYRGGNHRVSDEEASFRAVLDDVSSIPEGRETLKLINTQWDQASKEILWKQPEVMSLIHQQRESGIYDTILTELERQRALGHIPSTVPFLQAYKKIGDDLAEAGAFNHLVKKEEPEAKPQPSPVATRKATPKPAVKNGDKADAASPTRAQTRKAETVVNPLALSDEEFEKQFSQYQGRV